jgi:hypothetical protein
MKSPSGCCIAQANPAAQTSHLELDLWRVFARQPMGQLYGPHSAESRAHHDRARQWIETGA